MRRTPNLIPRLESCAHVQVKNPEEQKGRWLEAFPGYGELHIELGCGKGRFTADIAERNPGTLFVAIEKSADVMVVGMERVCERGIENARFVASNVLDITSIFERHEPSRIYINFCDPWPKNGYAKHRLTAPSFLRLYAELLPPGGEIHFKTDNLPLFEYSLKRFDEMGWRLEGVTYDLHANGPVGIMTDYELKFHSKGKKINRCVAVITGDTK